MRKRTKKIMIAVNAPLVLFLLFAPLWIIVNSRDISTPDTSDLAFEVVSVPDEDNAYTYFKQARELFDFTEKEYDKVKDILEGDIWDDELFKDLISKHNEALNLLKRGLT